MINQSIYLQRVENASVSFWVTLWYILILQPGYSRPALSARGRSSSRNLSSVSVGFPFSK